MSRTVPTDGSRRGPDRLAAGLAAGFIVLLLATEGALVLPGESDSASKVADFYTAHRVTIIVLQLLGFVASALLAAYAWRLRRVDVAVAWAGVLMALCSVVPGAITLVLAVVADTTDTSAAGRLNDLEPRGDDVLFIGILVFAIVVAVRLGRAHRGLGVLAGLVALSSLARLVMEAAGKDRGPLESVAPLSFLVLVAVMAVMSWRGTLSASAATARTQASPRPISRVSGGSSHREP
jgi:hypothetical protein